MEAVADAGRGVCAVFDRTRLTTGAFATGTGICTDDSVGTLGVGPGRLLAVQAVPATTRSNVKIVDTTYRERCHENGLFFVLFFFYTQATKIFFAHRTCVMSFPSYRSTVWNRSELWTPS